MNRLGQKPKMSQMVELLSYINPEANTFSFQEFCQIEAEFIRLRFVRHISLAILTRQLTSFYSPFFRHFHSRLYSSLIKIIRHSPDSCHFRRKEIKRAKAERRRRNQRMQPSGGRGGAGGREGGGGGNEALLINGGAQGERYVLTDPNSNVVRTDPNSTNVGSPELSIANAHWNPPD